MIVIPAIDLKDGQCVRLRQGEMTDATVFSSNPEEVAMHWLKCGAKRIHLVDLNGAFVGEPVNLESIKKILSVLGKSIPVQLGGGIRNLKAIESYLNLGIDYIIIGTAAISNPLLVKQACSAFSGHIIVGIDAKEGYVASDGWAKVSTVKALDLAQQFSDDGVSSIVYTDIGRDGMLSGVNIAETQSLAEAINIPIIASGGVSKLNDIKQLCKLPGKGVLGVITGRAIYEGTLNFIEAQQLANQYQK